jgi:hypothetical protein
MISSRNALCGFVIGAGMALASGLFFAGPAAAVIVYVGGQSFDILVTNRSYDQEPSLFTLLAMPWFTGDSADPSLAFDFAQAVNDQLGENTYAGFPGKGGPLFAFANTATDVFAAFQDTNDLNVQNEIQVPTDQTFNYAYLNPNPVPGPLPLAGAAVALRWSRALRQRQSQSRSR